MSTADDADGPDERKMNRQERQERQGPEWTSADYTDHADSPGGDMTGIGSAISDRVPKSESEESQPQITQMAQILRADPEHRNPDTQPSDEPQMNADDRRDEEPVVRLPQITQMTQIPRAGT